ncbi:MAG: VIT domain-containing protein [Planctomycetota bacterium]
MRALAIVLLTASPLLASGIHVRDSREPQLPVRLTHHVVSARVQDRAAQVTVRQTFLNTTDRRLEGTYLFPLPRGASVSSFAMTMGGKMVKGEIIDAEQARSIYLNIVHARRDPGLLEYCGGDLYKARVFPIEPRKTIEIELTYQQVLPADGNVIEFRYPIGTERLNRAPVEKVAIDVQYEGSMALSSVYAPSHAVEVIRKGETGARIGYEQAGSRPANDFQVFFSRTGSDLGFNVMSHRAGRERGTFLAMLGFDTSVQPAKRMPREIVYLLDTSGSMGGEKIEQARAALTEAVGMLAPEDRFTMISFATETRPFRRELVAASDQAKEEAGRWIRAQEASGGTALMYGLREAFRIGGDGRLPLVVLLTDGRPTVGPRDGTTILKEVAERNLGKARVFTFGIGEDLDVKLLDRIAEATRGKREYIRPGQKIGTVTRRFFRRIDQPIATDVVLETPSDVEDVYPREIGDLFVADQIVVLGRYGIAGKRKFRLRGMRDGKKFVREFNVKLAYGPGTIDLSRIWAQRKVGFLWDQMRLHGTSKELEREMWRLGLKYSIVTPYTSGLVLEEHATSRGPLFHRGSPGGGSFRGPNGGIPPGLRTPNDPEAPPAAPTTPGADVPPPAAATGMSRGLRSLKEEGRLYETGDRVRAADKTFVWNPGRGWVDQAVSAKARTKKVVAFSEAYFKLLERDPKIARYPAIGKWVTFEWKGVVYAVQPDEKE